MTPPTSAARLSKRLTLFDVYAVATGAMFSSGFFLLPGLAAAQTGGVPQLDDALLDAEKVVQLIGAGVAGADTEAVMYIEPQCPVTGVLCPEVAAVIYLVCP